MSTSSTAATANIQITDPTLLPFHQIKVSAFDQTQEAFATLYPQWEKDLISLKHFELKVRTQSHSLQYEEVVAEAEELKSSMEENLQMYWWVFKQTIEKIEIFTSNVSHEISFLGPLESHTVPQIQAENDHPTFFAQVKRSKEICFQNVEKLKEMNGKARQLSAKMVSLISIDTNNVNKSLQRICQIVDQNGKPLGTKDRGFNYASSWFAAVKIPKPQTEYYQEADAKLRLVLEKMVGNSRKISNSSETPIEGINVGNESSKSSDSEDSRSSSTSTRTMSGTASATISTTSGTSKPKQETAPSANTTTPITASSAEPVKAEGGTPSTSTKEETASNTTTTTTASTTPSSAETAGKSETAAQTTPTSTNSADSKESRKGSVDLGTKNLGTNGLKQYQKKHNNS